MAAMPIMIPSAARVQAALYALRAGLTILDNDEP